ncbi:MAG TPA: ATP-dependent protease ATPase subunit HslU [Clostridia bacterium]|nr:ATP-dependent protease ATPase subunit HslU [Clostridia bacterium]
MENLTPSQIVQELDKYIIGQKEAKRSVAVALRNRYRRKQLAPELRDEVIPKNILMIGPTGVGKTEIARRLAKLVGAPFIKVEATKFTEVGYVGRDVESMVRELVETAIRMVKEKKLAVVEEKAKKLAEERIVNYLLPGRKRSINTVNNPLGFLFGQVNSDNLEEEKAEDQIKEREEILRKLRALEYEDKLIEIEVEDQSAPMIELFASTGLDELGANFQDMFNGLVPKKKKRKKVTVAEARKILTQDEAQKLIDMDAVIAEAINMAEETGIIFIDEIDKVAGKSGYGGPDVSREGVQRDILPIVEGSSVVTKYGVVKTDHILFIAAGAFHISKPSDLIPELQGRFPIRVELKSLTKEDFKRILVEPRNALIKQYIALFATEGVKLSFTEEAIEEIARIAEEVNEQTENIGARRLHTVMEKLLEDLLFIIPDQSIESVEIDKDYVIARLGELVKNADLSRYIL